MRRLQFSVTYDAIESGVFGWELFDKAILYTKADELDLSDFGLGFVSLDGRSQRESVVRDLHRELKRRPNCEKADIVQHVEMRYGDEANNKRIMLGWKELREMAATKIFTIGAHTVSHPILSKVCFDEARHEIINGKRLIEERLGSSVKFFAYPNGQQNDFTEENISLVRKAGYLAACTTMTGRNKAGCDLLKLRRFDVTVDMSTDGQGHFVPELFGVKISGIV